MEFPSQANCICGKSVIPKIYGLCPKCNPVGYTAHARHKKDILDILMEKPIPKNKYITYFNRRRYP